MKEIVILDNGNVAVCGVQLGVDVLYAKKVLSEFYEVKENEHCLSIKCSLEDGYNNVTFNYSKDDYNRVSEIRMFYRSGVTECQSLYEMIKPCFASVYDAQIDVKKEPVSILADKRDGTCILSEYATDLVKVSLTFQTSNGNNCCAMTVRSDMLAKDADKARDAVYGVLIGRTDTLIKSKRKLTSMSCGQINKVLRFFLIVVCLIIAYLFALNGRYHYREDIVIDSWTGNVGYIEDVDSDIYWGG